MNQQTQSHYPLAPEHIKDKVVLIIGATGCLGTAVTKYLCQHGAQTILVAKQIKALEKLFDEVENLGAHSPALHAMNLMNVGIEQIKELREHIEGLFGRLDGLIFCSGKWGELTPVEHYKESVWLEIMHLNLNVPFLVTKNLMPLLRKTKQSTVIFSQSPMSDTTKAYHGAFNCSQAGLQTLMTLLHQENSYTSTRFVGFNPECVNSATRRKLYPGDPLPEFMFEAQALAPFYGALLGELGEIYKGKTLQASEVESVCTR